MIGKLMGGAAAIALAFGASAAHAQTAIKLTLDWVFQGPTSPFLVALEKGYYKAEGLDVTMDPGQGSAGAVQRVATGAYQIGFADVNATIEYNAKNPGKEILCVFMGYDFAPFGVYALKKSGITKPADLNGKKLGAPVFDAS
ncbi:MAG TPA: ABC transporter substrate-binding protein, partial [Reyranellaceae bacterium]|nr:ABC transporter substrate-binding protein [Reyranellaceae bacterium]